MTKLEAVMGYEFRNGELLEVALTHTSYYNENRGRARACNERLEFLGDSVLGFLTAEMLYDAYPNLPEGELTRRRAMLVCEASLASAARELGLGEHLRLGKGEENSGGRNRSSILADGMEAVLAAIYLDGGLEAARHFACTRALTAPDLMAVSDFKSALQERAQEKGRELSYRLVSESGPDHDKRFVVEALLDGRCYGKGEGGSKKEAEQAAAHATLKKL